jgi:hypothetical protein
MPLIKFTQDHCGHLAGAEIRLEHQLANTLVKEGVAELVGATPFVKAVEKPKEEAKPTKTAKPKKS